MILKLDLLHWVLQYYQKPLNDDPRLPAIFLRKDQPFVWETA